MFVINLCHLIIFCSAFIFSDVIKPDIFSSLSYYEVIQKSDIHHRYRRDLNGQKSRYMSFKVHGKYFNIYLYHSHSIFSPGFEAVSVDGTGQENKVEIDKDSYYEGYDLKDQSSHIIAHVETNMITATLISNNNTYIIEPMWRYNSSDLNKMLVYKLSDVYLNFTHMHMPKLFCGVNKVNPYKGNVKITPERNKRETSTKLDKEKNRCTLELVGDYSFYVNMGMSNEVNAVNYMVQVVNRVNLIYKETEWTEIGKNIGFQIIKATVLNSYSSDNKHIYNSKKKWDPDNLLAAFSRSDWSKVCLAHLFTYQDFDNGVIGLAYVATQGTNEHGGICSNNYTDATGLRHLNCALSSSFNWGRKLLTVEADLVTAHELGHNFGSNHDVSPPCVSSTSRGNYIMYATAVSGEHDNNKRFSPCSIDAISKVLKAKKDKCFEKEVDKFCGNKVVEQDEQCDPGLNRTDKCCQDNCRFRDSSYQCSDFNDLCCKKCMFASNETVCRAKFELDCKAETKCNGKQKDCPESPPLSGNECGLSHGKCKDGVCISLCWLENKTSCLCGAGENACNVCCNNTDNVCKPIDKKLLEKDGSPCALLSNQIGHCVSGKCEKYQINVQDQFSDLLKSFTFSKFARFMKANIVGTILTFSLMVWIPLACIVNYLDHKQKIEDTEKRNLNVEWMNPKSTDFIKKFINNDKKLKVKTKYHVPT
ncbi:disintegrin and metalloproteinase domain-containing protein 17 [Hydra vulgaris]|uniref:Disintegrin and metalloproteinase domain-containing protein 17 n=1 Tax=Hydra vulgaris TaxID=6087 RepID=T2MEE2_HYDVU|nr:disintegrin and metalloproteinase domain-containing protein 17 [Hydra vulgaris]XP_047128356.1 disintegrin and metalloproteinase domain-containing protein 17 [Hydra vulgaris]